MNVDSSEDVDSRLVLVGPSNEVDPELVLIGFSDVDSEVLLLDDDEADELPVVVVVIASTYSSLNDVIVIAFTPQKFWELVVR